MIQKSPRFFDLDFEFIEISNNFRLYSSAVELSDSFVLRFALRTNHQHGNDPCMRAASTIHTADWMGDSSRGRAERRVKRDRYVLGQQRRNRNSRGLYR